MKTRILFSLLCLLTFSTSKAQSDSITVRRIYDIALTQGECYENLRVLCKQVGHRLSGSAQAEKAVVWGKQTMEKAGFDQVWLQDVMVPKWVRGKEKGSLLLSKNPKLKDGNPVSATLKITALGGSV